MPRFEDQLEIDKTIDEFNRLVSISKEVGELVLSIRNPGLKNETAIDVECGSWDPPDDVVVSFWISQYREDEAVTFPNSYLRMTDEEITAIEEEKKEASRLKLEEAKEEKKKKDAEEVKTRELAQYKQLQEKYGESIGEV